MVYDPTLGYDDAMPDAYNKWLQKIEVDEWQELMEKYASDRLSHPLMVQDSDGWMWDYYAEHVYPYEGEATEDDIVE